MKSVQLIHNPQAGEGETVEEDLIKLLQEAGYNCSYASTKEKGWEKLSSKDIDMLVVAGGDGTIRKAALALLEKRLPIGLIPMGTANNIAKTLGIGGTPEEVVAQWANGSIKPFDMGRIYNLDEEKFFLEGLGFGVFPRLIKEVNKQKEKLPDTKLPTVLELLHDIVLNYEARPCTIRIDDAEYSGKYLMVEVMNTQLIGPNLHLVPFADPGDGMFEVVLITEAQREDFAQYILSKILGKDEPAFFNILKAKKLTIAWKGVHLHVDDAYVKVEKEREIKIELQEDALRFLQGPSETK